MAVDSQNLVHMTLGYNLLVADDLWIRLLQDIDYKDGVSQGWVYHMLDAITLLDPRFKLAYVTGAVILSIIVHDKEGARLLFERAVTHFPNDWALAYRASYHYLYEIKDCKRSAELMIQAVRNGAPAWVAALSGRLYAKSGQYELARTVILDTMERVKEDNKYYQHLKERLDELESNYRNSKTDTIIKGLVCKQ